MRIHACQYRRAPKRSATTRPSQPELIRWAFIMHFGKKLLKQRYEPWKAHYLDYNLLKSVLENAGGRDELFAVPKSESSSSLIFSSLFDEQVESIVFFALQQQGLLASQLAQWRRRQKELADHPASFAEEYTTLRENYLAAAKDLLQLIKFVDLNVVGIRKILKKHDKITGLKLSPRYLDRRKKRHHHSPVLHPLFEHGGLQALFVSLQDALEEMHHSRVNPRRILFRSHTTPEQNFPSIASDQSLSLRPQQITSRPTVRYHRQDTILVEIDAALLRLQQTRDFVHMLAAQMLISASEPVTEELQDVERRRRRQTSNFLNLMSTFLHLSDYYIVGKWFLLYS